MAFAQIPSRGFEPFVVRSTWLAWGASAWRQAEPGLTDSGTLGKSEGREELNHERPARACQCVSWETVPNGKNP